MIQSRKGRENIIDESLSHLDNNYLFRHSQFRNKESKKIILNYVFRNISLINTNNMVKEITESEYIKISSEINISKHIIKYHLEMLFYNMKTMRNFLSTYKIKHNPKKINQKARIYLHKVYRIAPVFDYNRAKKNLRILQSFLQYNSFWPHITTQIALIIYATDKKGKDHKKILQKNIRALCNCSAYAFHRSKNILNLD
jgi:hypothetical protein